jgi:superfamily I DNA/RNA helicase/PHP family Zn ribbon phosphoesterase
MRFVADLHIHSHFSISTSRDLTPEHLDAWARIKGISVVGSGDATHPGWLAELKQKLEPAEEGLFRLRPDLRRAGAESRPDGGFGFAEPSTAFAGTAPGSVRFLLSAEISTIYRRAERARKVHHLLLLPDLAAAEALQRRLARLGNLGSDGRPVLGLDSRDLLEIALEASGETCFIPAHIWTPWFSALGAKSGFDSIGECYRDLSGEIFAVETGLSSDPPMNWRCSDLDRYTLVSNSDAHSPEKLGREANLFDTELSYPGIRAALLAGRRKEPDEAAGGGDRTGGQAARSSARFLGTLEFFPQEGKYHYDGHRKCGVCWEPGETLRHQGLCTVCGKPVTVGVLNRVAQLADRRQPESSGRPPFRSLIPLKEILAELAGTAAQTQAVSRRYDTLLRTAGTELALLLELPLAEVTRLGGQELGEAVRRMRAGEVRIQPGYDGEYGRISLFRPGEARALGPQELLFEEAVQRPGPVAAAEARVGADLERFHLQQGAREGSADAGRLASASGPTAWGRAPKAPLSAPAPALNPGQRRAVEHGQGPALVLAGPGTGKTHTLTERILHLVSACGVPPGQILAVTFTNKAAAEVRRRLELALPPEAAAGVRVATFHAFGLSLLTEHAPRVGRHVPFAILDEQEREELLATLPACPRGRAAGLSALISAAKRALRAADEMGDAQLAEVFRQYERSLAAENAVDLDDLVRLPMQILSGDPQVLAEARARARWLLIDEVQDIDAAQYRLLRLLAPEPTSNILAIGDPDQAIYGFRGADARLLERFRLDYPETAVYTLAVSYRCSGAILQASAQVLPGEGRRLLEALEPGVRLRISEHPTDRSEAEFVARTIEELLGGVRFFSLDSRVSGGEAELGGFGEVAVLCRLGRQMEVLEKAMRDHAIPYQKAGELPWYQEEPARSLLRILKALSVPEQTWSSHRVVERRLAQAEALSRWRARLGQGEPLPRVIAEIGALQPEPGEALDEVIRRLAVLAEEEGGQLDRLLHRLLLGTPSDTVRDRAEQVSLLTLHAAKGLEFPCVFITGCEEGLLPYSLFADRHGDPDEERRLFYVGMTRARRLLYLSHARKRFLFGREHRLDRSPYLQCIAEELAERSRVEPRSTRGTEREQLELGI